MIELLTAGQNIPFTVALAVMLVIAVVEGVGALFGVGLSGLFDSFTPEVEVPDIDLDVSQGPPPVFTRVLGWLRVGEVPVLMLLIVFLTVFSIAGLAVQSAARGMLGGFLPAWVAVAPAALVALPAVRFLASGLASILPGDETDAVAEATFIGRIATIVLGTARVGSPAQARVKDQSGYTHYIMVEPDTADESFAAGTAVLLTEKNGGLFRAIRNVSDALVD
jgi:hypothetical protein